MGLVSTLFGRFIVLFCNNFVVFLASVCLFSDFRLNYTVIFWLFLAFFLVCLYAMPLQMITLFCFSVFFLVFLNFLFFKTFLSRYPYVFSGLKEKPNVYQFVSLIFIFKLFYSKVLLI